MVICSGLRQFPHQLQPITLPRLNLRPPGTWVSHSHNRGRRSDERDFLPMALGCTDARRINSRPAHRHRGSRGRRRWSLVYFLRASVHGCIILCEVGLVKKLAWFLLAALLMQLSGLRELCTPPLGPVHDCCPAPRGRSLPNPSSLPDCCLISLLNYQGSISEVGTGNQHSDSVLRVVKAPGLELTPAVIGSAPGRRQISLPISSPLSPLLQTCLLLI
jgi:hypothetical protein